MPVHITFFQIVVNNLSRTCFISRNLFQRFYFRKDQETTQYRSYRDNTKEYLFIRDLIPEGGHYTGHFTA